MVLCSPNGTAVVIATRTIGCGRGWHHRRCRSRDKENLAHYRHFLGTYTSVFPHINKCIILTSLHRIIELAYSLLSYPYLVVSSTGRQRTLSSKIVRISAPARPCSGFWERPMDCDAGSGDKSISAFVKSCQGSYVSHPVIFSNNGCFYSIQQSMDGTCSGNFVVPRLKQ
jgi:hypothetical protein